MGSLNTNDGWISLFNGNTTAGWHAYGKKQAGTAWRVDEKTLFFDAGSKNSGKTDGGDIVTDDEYENFHLKLEWKVLSKGNSGIIFYVHEDPAKYASTYHTGPEMQVLDNGTPTTPGHPDAKFYTHRAGDLYDLLPSKDVVRSAGQWNQVEIIANKGKLEFFMNGQLTLSTTLWDDNWNKMVSVSKFKDMPGFGSFRKGRIALQDHGDPVWYRNIFIKKL